MYVPTLSLLRASLSSNYRIELDRNFCLVRQNKDWEQRLDQRAGIYFFHRLGEDPEIEVLSETCQWEVPVTWAGDLRAAPHPCKPK